MAENVGITENNARFTDYPFDLAEAARTTMSLQQRKMVAIGSRIHPGEVVLDVGCNAGYLVDFVARSCVVHGVDLSPDLVAKAKTRLASAQVAGAEALPFPDKSVDVVVFAGVIEYVFDPPAVLRELARVARRALIVEANHEEGAWGRARVPTHQYMVRSYDEATLRQELSAVGTVVWTGCVGLGGTLHHRIMEVVL